jgi:hypothetical protein
MIQGYFPIQKVKSPIIIDLYRVRYKFGTTKIKVNQNKIANQSKTQVNNTIDNLKL